MSGELGIAGSSHARENEEPPGPAQSHGPGGSLRQCDSGFGIHLLCAVVEMGGIERGFGHVNDPHSTPKTAESCRCRGHAPTGTCKKNRPHSRQMRAICGRSDGGDSQHRIDGDRGVDQGRKRRRVADPRLQSRLRRSRSRIHPSRSDAGITCRSRGRNARGSSPAPGVAPSSVAARPAACGCRSHG